MVTQRVSETGVLTTVHLALLAVLGVITVLGILWGARLKRQRDHAHAVEEERMEELGIEPVPDEPGRALEEPSAHTDTATTGKAAATQPGATAPAATAPRHERSDTPEQAWAADDRAATAPTPPPPPVAPAPPPSDDEPVVATPAIADEPVAAAAPMDASPASEAEPSPAPATPKEDYAGAPVTTLKGLGPKVAARLSEHGITTVGDLAALDDAAAERLDVQLGAFTGRMRRDRWLEQARLLATGDRAGFEAAFGKL